MEKHTTIITLPVTQDIFKHLNEKAHSEILAINSTYIALNEKKINIADRMKPLSRKIGAHKKSSLDTASLKAEMNELSSSLKKIKKEITSLKSNAAEILKNNTTEASCGAAAPSPQIFLSTDRNDEHKSNPSSISIQPVETEKDILDWKEYVNKTHRCSVYHKYEIRNIFGSVMGHNTFYLMARDNTTKNVRGVFPCVQLKSALFGNSFVSLPFFNYGGPVGDCDTVEQCLIAVMADKAKHLQASSIELRDTRKRTDLPCKEHKVSMLLRFPHSVDSLWEQLGSKVRAQIKKSLTHQPEIRIGREELLTDFYAIFSRNMRDLGTPVYSKKLFAELLATSQIESTLCVVYINRSPVSCAFLIGHNDTMEIPWASTIKSANSTNSNMFMYWKLLEYSLGKGYLFFDFGRSSKDAGTYKFKKQWGATPLPLYWHYWLDDMENIPQINPDNPKYKLLIRFWKLMPLWLTRIIGPIVVKYIP